MQEHKEEWDKIIKPQSSLWSLNLDEVFRYRDLLVLLVRRDFVAFYKQTILGPIWFFIQPILTTFIYVFIFSNLAGIPTDGIPQPVFYLSGIVAWSYFSDCLLKTSTVFRDNVYIFGKVYFPRLIIPLSIVISNLVRLFIQFLLLICMVAYFVAMGRMEFNPSWYILLTPILILLMAILGLSFGMIVSSLTSKYRDLNLLVSFALPLLMYTTPVVYPLSTIDGYLKLFISLNPMTPIIEGLRLGFFSVGVFNLYHLAILIVFSAIVLAIGIIIFNKVEKDFVDTV